MSNGFIYWYQSDWSAAAAARVVVDLEHAGWMLTHPRSNTISAISEDGEQVSVDRRSLIDSLALEQRDSRYFLWWLDDQDSDVDHIVRRLGSGCVVHELDLNGISDHATRMLEDLIPLITAADQSTVGFVFDRNGWTEDLNWDAIMAGADVPITVAPDLLALTPELDRLHPQLPGEYRTFRTHALVIHDWSNEYPDFPDAADLRGASG